MKNVLLLPVFRFGSKQNSITIRIIETYSRINKIKFNFILNLDRCTYKDIDKYYLEKIQTMDKSFGYSGRNILKLINGMVNTLAKARSSDFLICESEYFYSVLYSYIIHIISRKPMIITINHVDDDMIKGNNLFHYLIYKHIFHRINTFLISDNNSIIETFKENFDIEDKDLFTINDGGIDSESFYTSDNKIYDLIFIGNIEDRKNAFMLPDIVKKLKNYNNNIKLLIVSHAGDIDKLKNIIRLNNLDENIDFVGYISEAEKKEFLAKSKIMIFPTKYEGFGTVPAEGLASYLPVIVFDIPTLDIFNKGIIKVKPFDVDEYINQIICLLESENLRKSLGIEGKLDAEQRFDYNYVSKKEHESIKNAIQKINREDNN